MNERFYVSGRNKNEIQNKAYEWREVFGLANDTNFDFVELLETLLPDKIQEFTFKVANIEEVDISEEGLTTFDPPQIQLRRDVYDSLKQCNQRARFTAAHELGHLILHKAFPKAALARSNVYFINSKTAENYRDAEWQANVFASRFLMPDDLVIKYDNPSDIALDFNVSQKAAELRFEEIQVKKPRKIPPHIKDTINEFKRNLGFPELE